MIRVPLTGANRALGYARISTKRQHRESARRQIVLLTTLLASKVNAVELGDLVQFADLPLTQPLSVYSGQTVGWLGVAPLPLTEPAPGSSRNRRKLRCGGDKLKLPTGLIRSGSLVCFQLRAGGEVPAQQ